MTFGGFMRLQLKKTIITGIPQIVQANGCMRKLVKVIVFVLCVSACLYQIFGFMSVYYEYPIVVDVFVSTPSEIRKPAFSICPHNSLNARVYCQIYSKHCTKDEEQFEDWCMSEFDICNLNTYKETMNVRFLPIVNSKEIAQFPEFSAAELNKAYQSATKKDNFFDDALLTDEGPQKYQKFYTFTDMGLPVTCYAVGVVWPNWTAETGQVPLIPLSSKFEVFLRTDIKDLFYNTIPPAVQVAVHDPFEKVNPFTTGFTLKSCTTYNIFLRKIEKFLLPPPYPTQCKDYKAEWERRRGEGPLTQKDCIQECLLNMSLERDGCYDPEYIKIPNDKPFCYEHIFAPSMKEKNLCREECPDACWQISFETKVEEAIKNDPENADDENCETNLVFLFTRLDVMTFHYKQKYETIEIFGYVGGYLGMWLGFSLIAAFDFLEVILSIVFYSCKTPNKKTKSKTTKTPVHPYYSTPKEMFI